MYLLVQRMRELCPCQTCVHVRHVSMSELFPLSGAEGHCDRTATAPTGTYGTTDEAFLVLLICVSSLKACFPTCFHRGGGGLPAFFRMVCAPFCSPPAPPEFVSWANSGLVGWRLWGKNGNGATTM